MITKINQFRSINEKKSSYRGCKIETFDKDGKWYATTKQYGTFLGEVGPVKTEDAAVKLSKKEIDKHLKKKTVNEGLAETDVEVALTKDGENYDIDDQVGDEYFQILDILKANKHVIDHSMNNVLLNKDGLDQLVAAFAELGIVATVVRTPDTTSNNVKTATTMEWNPSKEMANIIYDTIMKNTQHEQFDVEKADDQFIEGNKIEFVYNGVKYHVVVTVAPTE